MKKEFPQLRKQNHKRLDWSQKRPIHGADSETNKGFAILLADEERYIEPENIDDVLSFLNNIKYRDAYNFFYNIKFDFGAMLKWLALVDEDLFRELIFGNHGINYKQYNIYYIPGKLLSIKSHKHKVDFFDLANFYEGRLDKNAKHYLGAHKDTGINANKINTNLKYYYFNRDEIIDYCIQDARLTQQLGERLQENYHNAIGIYPKSYLSKAYVSEHYFKQECFVPSINKLNVGMLKYWWEAYQGGRFEMYQKGYFPQVYDYDLRSAYASNIAKLINIKIGEWKKIFGDINPRAYYGVYKCKVFAGEDNWIPAFGREEKGVLVFQNGHFGEIYLTKKEIEFVWNKHPELAKIDIIDGWEFYPNKQIYPFKDTIELLSDNKSKAKEIYGKDSMEYKLPKVTQNAFYGKQLNVNNGLIGKMWNIIFGTIITRDTRLAVLELALKAGKTLITIETDGIFTTEKIDGVRLGKELGDWELEAPTGQVMIGNGTFVNNSKLRTRGFPKTHFDLAAIIQKNKDKTKYTRKYTKPITLKEAFIQNKYTWRDINVWKKVKRTVSCNSDIKRKWNRYDYTFGDLSKNHYRSYPWYIEP